MFLYSHLFLITIVKKVRLNSYNNLTQIIHPIKSHMCLLLFLRYVFIYSFIHLYLQHFVRLAASQNYRFDLVAELKYELPKVHKFHKQKSKDIEVDLYRFSHL